MTTPGEVLLVAIVEMADGHVEAGQRYEDDVLTLLPRHGGTLDKRMRATDAPTEVHVIRFADREGYQSFMADPDRLALRDRLGAAAPTTRVIEAREL